VLHVAIGTFLGVSAALWFSAAMERRRASKAYQRAMELLHPQPLEMDFAEVSEVFAETSDVDRPLMILVWGGLAFCLICLVMLFAGNH
jgi:hypothetical protein